MNRMAFFRSLVVAAVIFFAGGIGTYVSAQAILGGPCVAPVTADHTCTDVSSLSEDERTARDCRTRRCMGLGDGVLCCRAAAAPAASAAPVPAEQSQSNVQGAAAAQTGAAITSGSGSCSYNGVKDPFCGKSVAEIIGKAIQFLLGAAGALFLAMFVYGGATWLTAGSSDRHEQAQKTLLNAAAGILVVILSYTMVSLLVRFASGLGVSQTDTRALTTEGVTPTEAGESAGGVSGRSGFVSPPSGGGRAAGSCSVEAVQSGCRSLVERVLDEGIYRAALITAGCTQASTEFCRNIRSPDLCAGSCPTVCDGIRNVRESDIPVPVPDGALDRLRAIDCTAECPTLCAAAFR